MKVLIWFLCMLAYAMVTTIFRQNGVSLGAIPAAILVGLDIWGARALCAKWDEHKLVRKYLNNKQKKITTSTQMEMPNFKNFTVCIYDTVAKSIRNEERAIDTNKFPSEKYAVDGIYYAIEKMNNNKKVRAYCSKSSWQNQVDNQNINKSKIKFCRKCGFELIDDSEFCSQCGTKII